MACWKHVFPVVNLQSENVDNSRHCRGLLASSFVNILGCYKVSIQKLAFRAALSYFFSIEQQKSRH